MLNKLPPRVMETILGLLDVKALLEMALVSPKMWKIVEKTPKKYGIVRCIGPVKTDMLYLGFFECREAVDEILVSYPVKYRQDIPSRLDEFDFTGYRWLMKKFLSNATIEQLETPSLAFGIEFWLSLNMKVKIIADPMLVSSLQQLQQFVDHFKLRGFIFDKLFTDIKADAKSFESFFQSDAVRSLDILQVIPFTGDLGCLMPIRAKDLFIGCSIVRCIDGQHLFDYLYTRILGWLMGTDKIDKIQIYMNWNIMNGLIAYFIKEFVPQLGWIDQTYKGMDLILRASDGRALLAVWDEPETCLYLIQCEYNFRRGRCLGSYERNEKSIGRICDLMRIVSDLASSRPELAGDAKKKLREECRKFNEYNKRATKMDLLTDSIWRPKGQRQSLWGLKAKRDPGYTIYPSQLSLLHAYRFTKAFEKTGVLPDVDEFKPLPDVRLKSPYLPPPAE